MSDQHKLEKQRTPKRFYFITALIYVPVLYALTIIHAKWYGFVLAIFSFAMLLWMRHTPMWQGLRVPLCFVAAFLIALTGLYLSKPEDDVSLQGQIVRETISLFVRLPIDEGVRSGKSFSEVRRWEPPDGYVLEVVSLKHSSAEILKKQDSESPYAVLQLHGGAFEAGLNDLYSAMAKRYCDYTDGGLVVTLEYRLWPEYAYPAQQEDAVDAWHLLVDDLGYAPENIFLAGDSAGGNLVLSLGLRLRDAGEAMPRALICMSPWADLSNSGRSHIENATIDPTFGVPEDEYDGSPLGVQSTYADALDAKNPDVSPSFGDYAGFPPMLLQASSDEVLLSDSEMVYENALRYGVDCTLTIYKGMFHVFQGSLSLLPESAEAWQEVEGFMARQMSQ